MKKVIIIAMIPTLFILSCINDGMSNRQKKYYDGLKNVPFTKKELKFIDSLEKIGYLEVKLKRPMKGIGPLGSNVQSLYLKMKKDVSNQEKGSLLNINKTLAIDLYSNIFEDSVIFDSNQLKVEVTYIGNPKLKTIKVYYSKDSLESWSGFKVVSESEDKYERVVIGRVSH